MMMFCRLNLKIIGKGKGIVVTSPTYGQGDRQYEAKNIGSIAFNLLPLDAFSKSLSGNYQFYRNGFLAGPDKNNDVGPVVQVGNVYRLNILEINEQEFLIQRHLASQN
jgi:hypothetical protein